MIDLPNIDSDFIPYVSYLVNPNAVNVILSLDHDYYHMLNDSENIIRYIHIHRIREKRGYTIEHRYNAYKSIGNKYGLKDTKEALLVAQYYQVFHSLIGDASDNIKSLIPKKGIKFWLKYLTNDIDIKQYTIDDIRQMVLNNECFIPILEETELSPNDKYNTIDKPKNKWEEFRRRMFIFDFYYMAKIVIGDKQIYDRFVLDYPYQKQTINDVIKAFANQVKKEKMDRDEIVKSLKDVNIYNAEYIVDSLI
jgi:hypothetical protein